MADSKAYRDSGQDATAAAANARQAELKGSQINTSAAGLGALAAKIKAQKSAPMVTATPTPTPEPTPNYINSPLDK